MLRQYHAVPLAVEAHTSHTRRVAVFGESPQPLYLRVYRIVADQIASGTLGPGDRLPAERALCEQLGVSRATVRRALVELVEDGLVESSVGRGSFVSSGPLVEPPNALLSLTELGSRRGLVATARVLATEIHPATLEESEVFGIAPGADLFHLERLRMLDDVPVAVDASRVPLARAPHLVDVDFTTASLYATLTDAGAPPARAGYTVEALPATGPEAALLSIEVGAPVLVTLTTAYDPADRVVELCRTVYRGDRYRFRATLARRR
jgi:DNA-binding GntR family transcriptional regulator